MPRSGVDTSEKNACTTVATVIHMSPSAGPPMRWSTAFWIIMMSPSDAMIMNGETPSFAMLPIMRSSGLQRLKRILVLFSRRNVTTNMNVSSCEIMVAVAAPATFSPEHIYEQRVERDVCRRAYHRGDHGYTRISLRGDVLVETRSRNGEYRARGIDHQVLPRKFISIVACAEGI